MKLHPLPLSLALLLAGCSDDTTVLPDTATRDAIVDQAPRDSALDGPAVDGPAVDGPAVDGPATDGPAVDGPAVDGPAVDGPAVDGPALTATVMSEVWYQGNTNCAPASMTLAASKNTITVTLSQIPFAQVPGTCKGHDASVTQAGSTLQLALNKTGGGACWTACWDFVVEIAVPPGSYTVTYLSFTDSVTVP